MKDQDKINLIEQWPVRARRARKSHQELAQEAGLTPVYFSLIINRKRKLPSEKLIKRVESVLEEWGG